MGEHFNVDFDYENKNLTESFSCHGFTVCVCVGGYPAALQEKSVHTLLGYYRRERCHDFTDFYSIDSDLSKGQVCPYLCRKRDLQMECTYTLPLGSPIELSAVHLLDNTVGSAHFVFGMVVLLKV